MAYLEFITDETPNISLPPSGEMSALELLPSEERNMLLEYASTYFANHPRDVESYLSTLFSTISTNDFDTVMTQPRPGFVCKSSVSSSNNKTHHINKVVYVNICYSTSIPEPSLASEDEIQQAMNGDPDASYRVPMSMGQPRSESSGGTFINPL
ncbi:hypothetical protein BDF14DRAFT_1748459, partial [Spinellus fusiger]